MGQKFDACRAAKNDNPWASGVNGAMLQNSKLVQHGASRDHKLAEKVPKMQKAMDKVQKLAFEEAEYRLSNHILNACATVSTEQPLPA